MIKDRKNRKSERGSILILCAICLVILLLFVGMAIDFGMAYLTKAKLAKACDAAALEGARYSTLGQTQVQNYAISAFHMNYGTAKTIADPTVTLDTKSDPNASLVNVSSTQTVDTSFLGLLPAFKTVNVSTAAQGKAARVEMTLVLDRSGSMTGDGGSTYLPQAVTDFIDYFDNSNDSVALVSFGITSSTDFAMTKGNFQQAVINDAKNLKYSGSTFSDGALQRAFTQELQPVSGNPMKVVVFFTDGGANTIQNGITCSPGSKLSSKTYDLGGQDPPQTSVSFMDIGSGNTQCDLKQGNCCNGANFPSASQNGSVLPTWTSSGPAGGAVPWGSGAIQVPINYTNVQADAIFRAISDANAMRSQSGITVYSIGLGSAPAPADGQFLCEVANDPSCSPTYNANQPAGVAKIAATAQDLDAVFQQVATIIRLRLSE